MMLQLVHDMSTLVNYLLARHSEMILIICFAQVMMLPSIVGCILRICYLLVDPY
jgi:hypothetical protein